MQNQITSSLDYVETQQKELSQILDSYEKSVGDMTTSINPHMGGGADAERDKSWVWSRHPRACAEETDTHLLHSYRLAESLNIQLDDISRSLGSLITDVNSLSRSSGVAQPGSKEGSGSGSTDESNMDPVAQIAAILNAHLHSLTWLETASDNLKRTVDEMETKVVGVSQGSWQGLKGRRAIGGPGSGNSRFGGYR